MVKNDKIGQKWPIEIESGQGELGKLSNWGHFQKNDSRWSRMTTSMFDFNVASLFQKVI